MDRLHGLLQNIIPSNSDVRTQLVGTVLIIFGCWLCHHLLIAVVWRRTAEPEVRHRWWKASGYTWSGIALILLGFLWFRAFTTVGTFFGLVSAGIAIALRDLVANVAGWVFLLTRRPFEVGDRVQLGTHSGDVVDINVFHFTLLEIGNWVAADQSTGRIIHIPNGQVMSQALANYGKGFHFIWNEMPVLLTFESNWQKAKDILLAIANSKAEGASQKAGEHARKASRRFMVYYQKLTPIVYTTVRESGVLLTIRYLCEPRRRRGTETDIWEAVLVAFAAEPDIDFAYPTSRFYTTSSESMPLPAPPAPGSSE